MTNVSLISIMKRFYWDIIDKNERKYILYYLIYQIPGRAGDMLRGRFVSKRVKRSGTNLKVMAGTRFRSMENLVVGDNVGIGFDNFIQALGGVSIGNNTWTAPGVKIWSVNHNYRDKNKLFGDQEQRKSPVIIGNDVWIASNAFILPGVNLPDGCIVSAGSIVGIKNYQPYSIIAGNPARIIGFREEITDNSSDFSP